MTPCSEREGDARQARAEIAEEAEAYRAWRVAVEIGAIKVSLRRGSGCAVGDLLDMLDKGDIAKRLQAAIVAHARRAPDAGELFGAFVDLAITALANERVNEELDNE
jgi:hypothetical protein